MVRTINVGYKKSDAGRKRKEEKQIPTGGGRGSETKRGEKKRLATNEKTNKKNGGTTKCKIKSPDLRTINRTFFCFV